MKDSLNNLINAAASSIQNAADQAAARHAAMNGGTKSPEIARIDQETRVCKLNCVTS